MFDLHTIVRMNRPQPAPQPAPAPERHPDYQASVWKNDLDARALAGRKKITREAVEALFNGQHFTRGNTRVALRVAPAGGTVAELFLHGTAIARRYLLTGTVLVRHADWRTNTTKERLNGVLAMIGRAGIHQKDFRWYLGDRAWDEGANWTKVN